MRSIESEGDTIDQAIERALRGPSTCARPGADRDLSGRDPRLARVRGEEGSRESYGYARPWASRLLGLEHEAPGMDSRKPSRRRITVSLGPPRPHQPLSGSIHGATVSGKPSSSSARAPSSYPLAPRRLMRRRSGARAGPRERSVTVIGDSGGPPHRRRAILSTPSSHVIVSSASRGWPAADEEGPAVAAHREQNAPGVRARAPLRRRMRRLGARGCLGGCPCT